MIDGPEPTDDRDDSVVSGTVSDAVTSSCSTGSVKGLSLQIIAEGQCLAPNAYVEVPKLSNVSFGPNVFPYLEAPARDAFVKALQAKPKSTLHVTSMLRTVAQQYLLYRWDLTNRCGIGIAAKPGSSNHETGLAFDTGDYGSWKSTFAAHGFKWHGSSDPPHFDYVGKGAISYKGVDVKAFQRLWNRNHPEDLIAEDGIWGPQTEARMKVAPAQGFPIGAVCGGSTTAGSGSASGASGAASSSSAGSGSTGSASGAGGAGGDGGDGAGGAGGEEDCGVFEGKAAFTCGPDGMGRGRCDAGTLVYEPCDNGCLIVDGGDDVCMGTSTSFSCSGSWGTKKAQNGDYYVTAFGCWVDENGVSHSDPGDNCIPACLAQAQQAGLCAGLSGPSCEKKLSWFAADAGRFGCLARLRVTNPKNGKSVVVVSIDLGPSCSIEKSVSHAVLDLSYPANEYLFGGPMGAVDKAKVHVVEVDPSTPLGPVE